MFQRRIYDKIKGGLQEFVFDFDESKFEFGASKGNVQFKDLILKPSKINQILKDKESPFMLKAGRISLVSVKVRFTLANVLQVSAWNLLSDSFALVIEDLHIILGPFMQLKKKPEDYREDVSAPYDFENHLSNIVEMNDLIEKNK